MSVTLNATLKGPLFSKKIDKAVQEAIKWATIELVAMLLNASVFSTDRIQDIDQQVGASPQARSILNGLMTNYGRGIFF